MLVMGVVFSAGTFGLNFQMTTALMATKVYDKGAGEYGVLGSLVAVGSLAGALLAARRSASRQRLVVGSGIVFGAITMVAGIMPSYLTFALILPVCGFAALTLITSANAFVQMAVDPSMRGRVMALYMTVFMGGTPFGAPLLGWVADHAGARWTLIGGGAMTVIGIMVAVVMSARRQGLVITRYIRSAWTPTDHEIGPVVTD
jgi:MFS family permease